MDRHFRQFRGRINCAAQAESDRRAETVEVGGNLIFVNRKIPDAHVIQQTVQTVSQRGLPLALRGHMEGVDGAIGQSVDVETKGVNIRVHRRHEVDPDVGFQAFRRREALDGTARGNELHIRNIVGEANRECRPSGIRLAADRRTVLVLAVQQDPSFHAEVLQGQAVLEQAGRRPRIVFFASRIRNLASDPIHDQASRDCGRRRVDGRCDAPSIGFHDGRIDFLAVRDAIVVRVGIARVRFPDRNFVECRDPITISVVGTIVDYGIERIHREGIAARDELVIVVDAVIIRVQHAIIHIKRVQPMHDLPNVGHAVTIRIEEGGAGGTVVPEGHIHVGHGAAQRQQVVVLRVHRRIEAIRDRLGADLGQQPIAMLVGESVGIGTVVEDVHETGGERGVAGRETRPVDRVERGVGLK